MQSVLKLHYSIRGLLDLRHASIFPRRKYLRRLAPLTIDRPCITCVHRTRLSFINRQGLGPTLSPRGENPSRHPLRYFTYDTSEHRARDALSLPAATRATSASDRSRPGKPLALDPDCNHLPLRRANENAICAAKKAYSRSPGTLAQASIMERA